MLKWMVPKPNRPRRLSGFAQRIAVRHSQEAQQVFSDDSLTYLLPSRGEQQDLESLLTCLELLARLLAQPKQAPAFLVLNLMHQARWLLSAQTALSSEQYQTLCMCYNQLVAQQQNPETSFSEARVLESLSQMKQQLVYPAEASPAKMGKKIHQAPQGVPGTVLQSLNVHLYGLLRKYPKLLKKEQRSLYLFLAGNTGRLERLAQTRFSWNAVLSQLSEGDAAQIFGQLLQQNFFQVQGQEGAKASSLSPKDRILQWVSGASLHQLHRLEQWVNIQNRRSGETSFSFVQEQEQFFKTANSLEIEEYLNQLSETGKLSPAIKETFSHQIQQFRQTNQRLEQLEQQSLHLWEEIQQLFINRFFTESQTTRQEWLNQSLTWGDFAADFLGYSLSVYLQQAPQENLLELAHRLETASPIAAQWLTLAAQKDSAALQAFVTQQSQQWNQTFLRWREKPEFRAWQGKMLPQVDTSVWEQPESPDFLNLQREVFQFLLQKETKETAWADTKTLNAWLEQGILLEGMQSHTLGDTLRTVIWRQHRLGEETILPVLRQFSFAISMSRQQLLQQLEQADVSLLQTVSSYLISQAQEAPEAYTAEEIQLIETLEQVLCTAPGSRSVSEHQFWQKQEMILSLKQLLERSETLSALALPLFSQKQAGILEWVPRYLGQIVSQDLPRMQALLQAVPYLQGQQELLRESETIFQEYEVEISAYLHTTSTTAKLIRPTWDAVIPQRNESFFRLMLANSLLPTSGEQTGLLVSSFLEELVEKTHSQESIDWEKVVEQHSDLVFLQQYVQQTGQGEEYQPLLSRLVSVMEKLKQEWTYIQTSVSAAQQIHVLQQSEVFKHFSKEIQELYQQSVSQIFSQAIQQEWRKMQATLPLSEQASAWEHSTVWESLRRYAEESHQQELYEHIVTHVRREIQEKQEELLSYTLTEDKDLQNLVEQYEQTHKTLILSQLEQEWRQIQQTLPLSEQASALEHSVVLEHVRQDMEESHQQELYERIVTHTRRQMEEKQEQLLSYTLTEDKELQALVEQYEQTHKTVMLSQLEREWHQIQRTFPVSERASALERSAILEHVRKDTEESNQQELYERIVTNVRRQIEKKQEKYSFYTLTQDKDLQTLIEQYKQTHKNTILTRLEREWQQIQRTLPVLEQASALEHSAILEHLHRYTEEMHHQDIFQRAVTSLHHRIEEKRKKISSYSLAEDQGLQALMEEYELVQKNAVFTQLEQEWQHIRHTLPLQEQISAWESSATLEHLHKEMTESQQQETYQRILTHVRRQVEEEQKTLSSYPLTEDKNLFTLVGQYVQTHPNTVLPQLEQQWRRRQAETPMPEAISALERSVILEHLQKSGESSSQQEALQSRTPQAAFPLLQRLLREQDQEVRQQMLLFSSPQNGKESVALLHRAFLPRAGESATEMPAFWNASSPMLPLPPGRAGEGSISAAPVVRRNVRTISPDQMQLRFHLAGYQQTSETYFIDNEGMQIVLTSGKPSSMSDSSFQYNYSNHAAPSEETARQQEERLSKFQQQLFAYEQQMENLQKEQSKLAKEALRKADQVLMEQRFYNRIEEDIRLAAKRHGFG